MIAIDTNVFVYAFDATEPDKQIRAREFFQGLFALGEATVITVRSTAAWKSSTLFCERLMDQVKSKPQLVCEVAGVKIE